jgi:hypothetical protein
MAESTPNADATSDAGATPAGVAEAVPAPTDAADVGDAGKRALAELRRELRETKAERDTLASAKRDAEDAERSELEKATRDRDEATSKVGTLELKLRKMEAAINAGIPDQWMRLNGDTPDELDKDAKSFAESLGKTGEGGGGATPADLGSGPRPGAPATGRDGFNAAIRARARR